MIPKKSTPIKNEILIDVFAKGLLNKDEMRIIFYIIRWSWGFNGVKRRQDWTKELTKRKIADEINIDRGKCCYILNKMIKENKVIVNDKCYQFNEHYEDWKKLTKRQSLRSNKVDETSINNRRNVNPKLIKHQSKVDEKTISTGLKPLQNKPLPDRKETLKENFKETLKEKGDIFIKAWKDFKDMRKKNNKGKSITTRAEEMILNKLNKLSDNKDIQIAILNESTMNGWKGVFPLKDNPQTGEFEYQKHQSKILSKAEKDKYINTSREGIKILIGKK